MKTRNLSVMFTDIKGFTSRTSGATRKGVADLIDAHERLLVPVFQYFDGVIVKTIGDAFLVYFESPTDAVLCGVTIQEVLRRHNDALSEQDRLEVRVAINVGDVELKENDIIGEAVNIASRLEGVTEAGEVYFTDAIYQTMNRKEAPSAEVGERIFKGIEYPIRVYKVIQDPNSELAHIVSQGVDLTDKGPVLKGIREKINGRKFAWKGKAGVAIAIIILLAAIVWVIMPSKTQRVIDSAAKLMANGAYVSALDLIHPQVIADPSNTEIIKSAIQAARGHVQTLDRQGSYGQAFAWLQEELKKKSYLHELKPLAEILDAKSTVSEVLQQTKYANMFYPDPLKELLNRYPKNAEVSYTAAKLLEKKWHTMTILWLYEQALNREGYPGDGHIFDFCTGVLSGGRIDYQKFAKAEAILRKYYPEREHKWAKGIMDNGSVLAVRNAWNILVGIKDPVTEDPYYQMLSVLVYGKIRDDDSKDKHLVLKDQAYEVFSNQTNPERRKHILALHEEFVKAGSKFTAYGRVRDAVKDNLQKLKKTWEM